MHARRTVLVLALVTLLFASCGDDDDSDATQSTTTASTRLPDTTTSTASPPAASGIVVTSSAFANNEQIPVEYSCDGTNATVPIAWTGIPTEAKSVALEVHDPDAPVPGGFLHWMVFDLPPEDGSVPPVPDGARQGPNGLDQNQWLGPCPPPGSEPHRYRFTVYALDKDVQGRDELAAATIEKGTLVGLFSR